MSLEATREWFVPAGAIGAFVSDWIIRKSTMRVVSGSDLIRRVYNWDKVNQRSETTTSTVVFNRFCSADLPAASAFYNAVSGLVPRPGCT